MFCEPASSAPFCSILFFCSERRYWMWIQISKHAKSCRDGGGFSTTWPSLLARRGHAVFYDLISCRLSLLCTLLRLPLLFSTLPLFLILISMVLFLCALLFCLLLSLFFMPDSIFCCSLFHRSYLIYFAVLLILFLALIFLLASLTALWFFMHVPLFLFPPLTCVAFFNDFLEKLAFMDRSPEASSAMLAKGGLCPWHF